MEEAHHHHHHQYWMWMKRKENNIPLMSGGTTTSWEEKAFAQDSSAIRSLGGCIWPPRSYSCSFCMREFRSAQALGGHMNVHRRDRARLKQCLISPHTTTTTTTTHQVSHQNHQNHLHHHSNINLLDNYNLDPADSRFLSSINNNSRVSATKDKPFLYPFSSDDDDDDGVETDLCMGLNSVVGRNRAAGSCGDDDHDDHGSDYKRRTMPFFINHCHLHSEVIELNKVGPPSMDDLDLELRLGDSPKVN